MISPEEIDKAREQRIQFYKAQPGQEIIRAMGGAEACAEFPIMTLEQHPASGALSQDLDFAADQSIYAGVFEGQLKKSAFFLLNLRHTVTGEGTVLLVYDYTVVGTSKYWSMRNLTALGPTIPQQLSNSGLAEILTQLQTKEGWHDGADNWMVDRELSNKPQMKPQ